MNYAGYNESASQFAGGGFMPSPAPNADNAYGNGGAYKTKRDNQTLRAVTVRQLLKADCPDDGPFFIDGAEVGSVSMVGQLQTFEILSNKASMVLDDGTGSMALSIWTNDESQVYGPTQWEVGAYLRAVGHPRIFNGQRSVNAFAIKRITDHNEVSHHFLLATVQTLSIRKGGITSAPPPAAMGAYGALPAGPMGGLSAPAPGGAGSLKDMVLNLMCAERNMDFTLPKIMTCFKAQGHNIPTQELQGMMNFLADNGLVYTTLDDSTWRAC